MGEKELDKNSQDEFDKEVEGEAAEESEKKEAVDEGYEEENIESPSEKLATSTKESDINTSKKSEESKQADDSLNSEANLSHVTEAEFKKYEPKDIPDEIKGWNWGAFAFNIFWGIGNKTYLPLLCLIPFFNIIWMFVCGFKGNEWAWKDGDYQSIEEFKLTQKSWNRAGIAQSILIIINFVLVMLMFVFMFFYACFY